MKQEYSIQEFVKTFDNEYCLQYLKQIRYEYGEFCPFCGCTKVYITNRGYKCSNRLCHKKFTLFNNTVFFNTKEDLATWFLFIYFNSINKKNVSSKQNSRNFGMTQTSAWHIQSKLRSVMSQDKVILSGTIEVDEAFISKAEWHRWGSEKIRKTPVVGLIERGGKVVLKSVPNRKKDTIIPIIYDHVEKGSTVYTDGYYGYRVLEKDYGHEYVEHKAREWVRGDVHTNTIEGVWSFFKRNIRNAHHQISNKHLQSYLDECAFRYNNRHLTQMERFNMILKNCIYG